MPFPKICPVAEQVHRDDHEPHEREAGQKGPPAPDVPDDGSRYPAREKVTRDEVIITDQSAMK